MTTADGIRQGIYSNPLVRRVAQWLDAVPHPPVGLRDCARIRGRRAMEPRGGTVCRRLCRRASSAGCLGATAVETNILDPAAVRAAVSKVFNACISKSRKSRCSFPIR